MTGVLDTWVDEASPDSAHGGDDGLVARLSGGKGSRILLAFDLRKIEGAHITSALLELTLTAASGAALVRVAVSGIKAPWRESATWQTQPQFSERTQTYAIVGVESAPGPFTWDVTQLLRDTLEATGSLEGVALSGPFPAGGEAVEYGRTFAAREAGEQATPALTVDYVPGAAVRAAASPAGSPSAAAEAAPPGARAVRIGVAALAAAVLFGTGVAALVRRRKGVR